MLSRRLLRGVIAYRQIQQAAKPLQSTAGLVQARLYSSDAGSTGADKNGANGDKSKQQQQQQQQQQKTDKPTNGKPEESKDAKKAEETPEKIIEKLKLDLEESKMDVLRAMADQQNSIRIARDDVRKAKEFGNQKFATALLDVNDILERALGAVTQEKLASNADFKNFYEGVQMTERLMIKVYEQHDVKRFSPLGEKFDPNKHQALQELPDPSKEPGTVCHVLKPGYMLKDRLLRPASVMVVKDTRPKEGAAS